MNIREKLYSITIHLNAVIAFVFFFKCIVYLGVVTSDKILFPCVGTSNLSYAKDSFLKCGC